MKVKELVEKLQALDPDVEVLIRTVYDEEIDWEPISEVETVQEETVYTTKDGQWGYFKVPCVRLYE